MTLVLLDRAKVVATSMSGNTSNYTLTNTPETGFVDFTGVGDGNTTYYAAVDNAGNFEIGIGTFATSGEVLTRTDGNVIKSTNSNTRVSWPSNSTPTVFITQPADKAVFTDANGDATLKTSDGAILNLQTSDTTVTSGNILGAIHFQAPDEAQGGDGIEIAAVIEAEAKTTFKSTQNRTDLVFKVANDAAATERMRLTKSGVLKLSSTTNEDNLVIKTTFGSETGGTPDVKLHNDSTQAGTDNSLGILKYTSNTANYTDHVFADIVGMAFSTTQNALEGGVRFRFAEGSDHSWGANEWISFRPEKIQYYNGTSTTTLAFTTPTAGDVTLTLPNTTGTIALTSDGVAADDISTGDAAVTIGTSSGDITLDTDGDIILDANNAAADGGGIFFKDNNNIFGHFVSNDFYGASYLTTDFELRSTNTGTFAGPILNLWRNSNSPAVNDDIGQVNFIGEDSASNRQAYAGITGEIINPTHGNEEAQIYFILANGDNSVTNGFTTTYKFGASRLLLDGTTQLQFGDNGTYIHQSADGVLDLVADTELELNGAIVDINSTNGNVDIGTTGGNVTLTGDVSTMTFTNNGSANIVLDPNSNGYGVEIKGNNAGGYLQLNCEANSHGVKIQSPDHSAGQSYTLKLPDNQVAVNKILKVKSISGSGATAIGQLEFADDASGGGGGSVAFDDITNADAAVDLSGTSYIKFEADAYLNLVAAQSISLYSSTDVYINSNNGNITFQDNSATYAHFDSDRVSSYMTGNFRFIGHVHDTGGALLTLQIPDTAITDGNLLGALQFQAPNEADGGDGALVSASIEAEADATFSATVNSTDLVFKLGTSGAATEKMRLTHEGGLTLNNAYTLPTSDGSANQVLQTDGSGTLSFATVSGGGSSGVTVQDEGGALSTTGTTLNFVGAGVVASGTGATKTVTIAGGGSGITVQDEGSALSTVGTTLNFVGAGVTASGTGATKTVTISGGGGGITTGKAIAMAMVFG